MKLFQIILKHKLVSLLLLIVCISASLPLSRFVALSSTDKVTQAKDTSSQSNSIVHIHLQPEAPLRITLLEVDTSNLLRPTAKLIVTNMTEKPIQSYSIRHDSISAGSKSSGITLTNAASLSSMLQPGLSETAVISDVEYSEPIKRLVISVDYVEFEDGTKWGNDSFKSGQRLTGKRAGAQAAIDKIASMVERYGSQFLVDNLDSLEIPVPQSQDDEWKKGYITGVNTVRERLRQSYRWNGIRSIQDEIKRPFDATGFKNKEGGK